MLVILPEDERRSLTADEKRFRTIALRSALLCVACVCFINAIIYAILLIAVDFHSEGTVPYIIKILLIHGIVLHLLYGIFLLVGVKKKNVWCLTVCLGLGLIISLNELAVGIIGMVYFIREGTNVNHYLLAAGFFLLTYGQSFFVSHDLITIYAYTKSIQDPEYIQSSQRQGNNNANPTTQTPKAIK